MRILLGLAALAASVNAQTTVTLSGAAQGVMAAQVPSGQAARAAMSIYQTVNGGTAATISPNGGIFNAGPTAFISSAANFDITLLNPISTLVFVINTNTYTAQLQYRWAPNYTPVGGSSTSPLLSTCDTCTGGNTAGNCDTFLGPGGTNSPVNGFSCSSLQRTYTMTNIAVGNSNQMYIQMFDLKPVVNSYSFSISRASPPIVGDPQIYGLQGQDFQVHGIPDEIFNLITYPNLQVNARFVYLSSGACHDNFTACFAHPGTYIGEEGIRLGKDKIHVQAGSYKKGLTVSVNGQRVDKKTTEVKLGSVEIVNHRRVVVKTPFMELKISNSDHFLNQETSLFDQKLMALGADRRQLLVGENFHSEVPLHGLQGQTWRNVEYPSGLEYEGSIEDYHVTDGNLFGTSFTFNQYKH